MTSNFDQLVREIRACRVCAEHLPNEPRPVFQIDPKARIAIVGQAPGIRAHDSGRPFTDPSGVRLRQWLGVDDDLFYNPSCFAIVPAGFCFPGLTPKGADRPPRKECAPLWHERVFGALSHIELIVLAGVSGQKAQLGGRCKPSLTETVRAWRDYAPRHIPLPHPSWRNNSWIKRNPWFAEEVLPALQARVSTILQK